MPIVLVYGDFEEPMQGEHKNFFLVRIPAGRVPWSKRIAPAINRLVQSFVPDPSRQPYRRPRHSTETKIIDGRTVTSSVTHYYTREKKRKAHWYVDAADQAIWDRGRHIRYEWDGLKLVKVL